MNTRVLLSDSAKKKVATTVTNVREKLKMHNKYNLPKENAYFDFRYFLESCN